MKFTIPGKPQPKQRPRGTKSGRHYTPKKTKVYETKVGRYAFAGGGKQIYDEDALYELHIIIYKKKPKSSKDKDHTLCKAIWDIDNIMKSIKDGMEKICYKNDNQVVAESIIQVTSENCHRVEVEINKISNPVDYINENYWRKRQ